MSKISALSSRAKNAEANDVITQVLSASTAYDFSSEPEFVAFLADMGTLNQELKISLYRIKTESDLEDLDHIRDSETDKLFKLVEGYTAHPVVEIKEAADKVERILRHYGLSIIYKSYSEQSALTESLLEDLDAESLGESLSVMTGCSELIENLRNAQDAFEEKRIAYEAEKGKESILRTATEIKNELVKMFNNKFIVYLNGAVVFKSALFGEYANTVKEVIDTLNAAIKRRR